MATGYCTTEDVRRALREKELPGDIVQDVQIAVDAIAAQTEWLEKTYKRHWYSPSGSDMQSEASNIDVPDAAKTRDDEHDLPTHGASVHGASEFEHYRYSRNSDALLESGPRHERRRGHHDDPKRKIRISFGDANSLEPPVDDTIPAYTRITFDRRDVEALNELHVVNEKGGFDDWTAEKTGGVGNTHRGEDYWVRVNNDGITELYLDVHAMDDDLPSLSNAVYVDIDYGHEGIPRTVRRAVAFRAAAQIIEEPSVQIPDNVQILDAQTLAQRFEDGAEELLEVYEVEL